MIHGRNLSKCGAYGICADIALARQSGSLKLESTVVVELDGAQQARRQ